MTHPEPPNPRRDGGRELSSLPVDADEDALRARYGSYCQRHVLRLLSLMPSEAVRALYRRARNGRDHPATGGSGRVTKDPLGTLVAYCRRTLPLPPLDVWREDVMRYPAAHLDDGDRPGPSDRDRPVHLALRTLHVGADRWTASLDVRPDGEAWRGWIAFRHDDARRTARTGEIFREECAEEVRSRFMEFDDRTLRAFLRSVAP